MWIHYIPIDHTRREILLTSFFNRRDKKHVKLYLCKRGNHQNCSELENNTEALINQTGAVAAAAEGGQTADEGGRDGARAARGK